MAWVYPHTFVDGAGHTASGAEVMDNFTAVKSVVDANETAMELAVAQGFATYKDLPFDRQGIITTGTGAGTYHIGIGTGGLGVVPGQFLTAEPFYFDPADWGAGARSTFLRLRAFVLTNAVAPAANFTIGLYPVASWGGASGSNPAVASLGAVVAGSAPAAIVTPGATSQTQRVGSDFAAPAAGWYCLCVVISALIAANAQVAVEARLQMRQV